MDCDNHEARALMRLAVQRAQGMNDLLARFAGGPIAAAGDAVVADLRALAGSERTHATTADVVDHLRRLDHLLTLAVGLSARRAQGLADRLAVAEEMSCEPSHERLTAVQAAALAARLSAHARLN